MTALAIAAAAFVVLWAVLVVVAQVLNPEQSPLSMGMSGLARGRAPLVIKASFIARGLSALLLVAALPTVFGTDGFAFAGLVLLWVWGVGSAALAIADTDMPGEEPTRAGAAHALIALGAYVAGTLGAVILSLALRSEEATAGVARWALPIALAAAVALVVQLRRVLGGGARGAERRGSLGRRSGRHPGRPGRRSRRRSGRRGGAASAHGRRGGRQRELRRPARERGGVRLGALPWARRLRGAPPARLRGSADALDARGRPRDLNGPPGSSALAADNGRRCRLV